MWQLALPWLSSQNAWPALPHTLLRSAPFSRSAGARTMNAGCWPSGLDGMVCQEAGRQAGSGWQSAEQAGQKRHAAQSCERS